MPSTSTKMQVFFTVCVALLFTQTTNAGPITGAAVTLSSNVTSATGVTVSYSGSNAGAITAYGRVVITLTGFAWPATPICTFTAPSALANTASFASNVLSVTLAIGVTAAAGSVTFSCAGATLPSSPQSALSNVLVKTQSSAGVDIDATSSGSLVAITFNPVYEYPKYPAFASIASSMVTWSSEYSYTTKGWAGLNMFDGDVNTCWLTADGTFAVIPGAGNEWLKVNLGTKIRLQGYSIYWRQDCCFPYRTPANFTIHGSNDGSNWVELDRRTSQEGNKFVSLRTDFKIPSSSINPVPFQYFMMNVTQIWLDPSIPFSNNPTHALTLNLSEMRFVDVTHGALSNPSIALSSAFANATAVSATIAFIPVTALTAAKISVPMVNFSGSALTTNVTSVTAAISAAGVLTVSGVTTVASTPYSVMISGLTNPSAVQNAATVVLQLQTTAGVVSDSASVSLAAITADPAPAPTPAPTPAPLSSSLTLTTYYTDPSCSFLVNYNALANMSSCSTQLSICKPAGAIYQSQTCASGSYISGNAKNAIGAGTNSLIMEVYSDIACSSAALIKVQIVALNACQITLNSTSIKFILSGSSVNGQYFSDSQCTNLLPSITAAGTADGTCSIFTLNGIKVNGKLFTAAKLRPITAACLLNTSLSACTSSASVSKIHQGNPLWSLLVMTIMVIRLLLVE